MICKVYLYLKRNNSFSPAHLLNELSIVMISAITNFNWIPQKDLKLNTDLWFMSGLGFPFVSKIVNVTIQFRIWALSI